MKLLSKEEEQRFYKYRSLTLSTLLPTD